MKKQAPMQISEEENAEVQQMFAKYMTQSSGQQIKRVTYTNLYPNQNFKAIKQQKELGFVSFEKAKQTQPLKQMVYLKF